MLQKNRTQKSPLQQPRAIAIVPLYLRSVLAPGAKRDWMYPVVTKEGRTISANSNPIPDVSP